MNDYSKESKVGKVQWKKSSFCDLDGCVEVAQNQDRVWIRNSTDADMVTLSFGQSEWSAFVEGVKSGEFDS